MGLDCMMDICSVLQDGKQKGITCRRCRIIARAVAGAMWKGPTRRVLPLDWSRSGVMRRARSAA